ncbi:MAG: ABC transporter permease [Proteobacteria bacterium]|nr:MAG: ABC transporter permease [Pseudomonadota bacterium]
MTPEFLGELWQAVLETLTMLVVGLSIAGVLGLGIGTALYWWNHKLLGQSPWTYRIVGTLVNIVRSFPFVILMIAVIPLSRLLTGSSIGALAATVPLSIAGTAYFARLVELSLNEVPDSILEAGTAMGASKKNLIFSVIYSEARSTLVLGFTSLSVSYLSYTAAAGIIGGGGIGDLAIRYGYYRFQTDVMIVTVIGLIIAVQIFQALGNLTARLLDKRN